MNFLRGRITQIIHIQENWDAPPRVKGSGQPKLCLKFSISTDASNGELAIVSHAALEARNFRSLIF